MIYGESFDPDESPDGKDLNIFVDDLLSQDRPERYTTADKDWMARAVEEAERQILQRKSVEQIAADEARRLVIRREGEGHKKANRFLRDIGKTGQLPLGWGDSDFVMSGLLHQPLCTADNKRVRAGAATRADLEEWTLNYRRREEKHQKATVETIRGAELLVEKMTVQRVDRTDQLRVE